MTDIETKKHRQSCNIEIIEEYEMLVREYAFEKDENLTEEAIELKLMMIESIEKIEALQEKAEMEKGCDMCKFGIDKIDIDYHRV